MNTSTTNNEAYKAVDPSAILSDHAVVMLTLPRWDGPYASTSYAFAKGIARSHRVFLIDNPFTLMDWIRQRKEPNLQQRKDALLYGKNIYTHPEKTNGQLTVVTPRLVLPVNWINSKKYYDFAAAINDWIVYKAIKQTLQDHDLKKFIWFNSFNPLYGNYFPKEFKPTYSIYQSVDDISQSRYVQKHGTRKEKAYAQRADMVITTSAQLKRNLEKVAKRVVCIPNAADVTLFSSALEGGYAMPEEIKPYSGRKIIGYTGNLDFRLDYELLKRLAVTYPEALLLLVGPENANEASFLELKRLPNVVLTGKKALQELPAYLQYMHVALIPFKCNRLTSSIYPLKINEYLAAGKAVVSTGFSDDILDFKNVIQIGTSAEDFVTKVGASFEPAAAVEIKRRAMAASENTWEDRLKQFWYAFQMLLEKNKPKH